MSELGSGPYLFWVLSLLSAAALGLVIGLLRAWWLASLGLVVPGGLVIASQFLSNDTLPGAEDLSWRILALVVAVEYAVLFFVAFGVGALIRGALGLWRRHARADRLDSSPR